MDNSSHLPITTNDSLDEYNNWKDNTSSLVDLSSSSVEESSFNEEDSISIVFSESENKEIGPRESLERKVEGVLTNEESQEVQSLLNQRAVIENDWNQIVENIHNIPVYQRYSDDLLFRNIRRNEGKWTLNEEKRLHLGVILYKRVYGENHRGKWAEVCKIVQTRNNEQCGDKWGKLVKKSKYKQGKFSKEESLKLMSLLVSLSNGGVITDNNVSEIIWDQIETEMGRSKQQCKSRFHTLRKDFNCTKKNLAFLQQYAKNGYDPVKTLKSLGKNPPQLVSQSLYDKLFNQHSVKRSS